MSTLLVKTESTRRPAEKALRVVQKVRQSRQAKRLTFNDSRHPFQGVHNLQVVDHVAQQNCNRAGSNPTDLQFTEITRLSGT
jgi:hypothetical protein